MTAFSRDPVTPCILLGRYPFGLAVNPRGDMVAVADSSRERVSCYSLDDGSLLGHWASEGTGIADPFDVCLCPELGGCLVANARDHNVLFLPVSMDSRADAMVHVTPVSVLGRATGTQLAAAHHTSSAPLKGPTGVAWLGGGRGLLVLERDFRRFVHYTLVDPDIIAESRKATVPVAVRAAAYVCPTVLQTSPRAIPLASSTPSTFRPRQVLPLSHACLALLVCSVTLAPPPSRHLCPPVTWETCWPWGCQRTSVLNLGSGSPSATPSALWSHLAEMAPCLCSAPMRGSGWSICTYLHICLHFWVCLASRPAHGLSLAHHHPDAACAVTRTLH